MSKETKTYHIDGCDYSFDFSVFKHLFSTYKSTVYKGLHRVGI
jgi:hypothetical protein